MLRDSRQLHSRPRLLQRLLLQNAYLELFYRQPTVLVLWLSYTLASFGVWMTVLAATWFMTNLTASPLLIASVQTGFNLPVLLLAIPAGILGDRFDRFACLSVSYFVLTLVSASLACLVSLGAATPLNWLVVIFIFGCATAMTGPVWYALLASFAGARNITLSASALSLGGNLGRVSGVILGGLLLEAFDPEFAFVAAGIIFAATLLLLWRRRHIGGTRPVAVQPFPDHGSLRNLLGTSGFRLQLTISAAAGLVMSAVWALLPVLVAQRQGGASLLSSLTSTVVIGTMLGSLLLLSSAGICN